ncbi:MAG TPA: LpqB family beta-propeller domain-containing protein, partial [Phycicoccus sp.]|nr:LpqB family beta-propeller domain-containing protein [Phycicoccus sp.]
MLSWWRGTTRTEVPSFAANLSNPTFDALGYLWVGAGGPASSATSSPAPGSGAAVYVLSAAEATPTARPVAAPWLSGRSVRWVRVSPDGERVAIVSADGQGVTRLDVTGVVRSSNGIPQRLARLRAQHGRQLPGPLAKAPGAVVQHLLAAVHGQQPHGLRGGHGG